MSDEPQCQNCKHWNLSALGDKAGRLRRCRRWMEYTLYKFVCRSYESKEDKA